MDHKTGANQRCRDIAHYKKQEEASATPADNDAKIGTMYIILALRPALSQLPKGSFVRILLSNDRLRISTDEDVAALFREMITAIDLHIHIIVCVSGDTQAMSKLLDAYIEALISGHIQLRIVHGKRRPKGMLLNG